MLALRQVNGVNFQVGHGPEILCKLNYIVALKKLKPLLLNALCAQLRK